MELQLRQLRFTALGLALALLAGCVGMASQEMIARHLKEAGKFQNCYTNQKYDTMDESLKATRDYFNQDLARVSPLREPLKSKALIIIPSEPAIKDHYDKVTKGVKDWTDMQMRTRMADYDKMIALRERHMKNNSYYQQMHSQIDETTKRMYEHLEKTDEIRNDFLVEALKKRHIFQEVAVQKAQQMGKSPAATPNSGVVIYLVTLMKPASPMNFQNLWYLKIAGSDEPWLIGSDESASGWLANVEKTAREQLKFEKP